MRNIMARPSKNRNISLLTSIRDLKDEVSYDDFEYKEDFSIICRLIPNVDKEKLDIEIIDVENCKKSGLVYLFVIDNKIFKIGQSITPITKRIQSYNCGKVEYRINGTNSTTNYFVLQSLLKINLPVDVYAFFPDQPEYELFGKKYQDSWQVSKRAENIIINDFIKNHNKKPIGCTQK